MDKGLLSKIALCFISSRLLFFFFAVIAAYFVPLQEGYLGNQFDPYISYFAWIWANFDGRHFLSIATQSYQNTNFAYFPLYPALISTLGYVFPVSHIYIGILISAVSFFLGLYFLYKIVILDYSKSIAITTLALCSFFPLAFYYHSVYSDSLFFLFSILAFYFARRKSWVLCGIFGALLGLTRLSGLAIIPAILVEWYITKPHLKGYVSPTFLRSGFGALALSSLGFMGYLFYLQFQFGDFMLFQKSFSAWNQAEIVFPLQVVWRYLKIFFTVSPNLLIFWIALLEFVTLILYFIISLYILFRVRISYGVFMLVLLSLVTFTGTFAGTPRYALHLFPLFLGLGVLLAKRRLWRYFTYIVYFVLGIILTALFTRGYFIA